VDRPGVTQLDAKALDALVSANLDLPRIIARQMAREMGGGLSVDDLESAGREGLVRAAQRFDGQRGVTFRTFANHRIRGAVLDALRREATIPRRARKRLLAMQAALDLNENAAEEMAAPAAPGAPPKTHNHFDLRLADHLANLATAMSLGLVAETALEDEQAVAIDRAEPVDETVERTEQRARLRAAVASFPDPERTLLERHYFDGERFDLVAKELGLSKSWASRLHTRAVARLTDRLRLDRR
jgi:RNA polymerase sigma factor FliA